MRWLVGWSSIAASFGTVGAVGNGGEGRTVHPVGSQLLWGDPDPLWAVGDWRPDEIRVIGVATPEGAPTVRLAVLGCCGATDEQLRVGLLAARGGAMRHLTAWPGSYTAVVQIGRRITVAGDLAGARPVFHTPWPAAPPTPPPPCRSPTSSRPSSTSGTSPRCSPARRPPRPSATARPTRACGGSRRATP
ncbi:hypothetical protein SBADM41S_03854 [Streptomyces badius]